MRKLPPCVFQDEYRAHLLRPKVKLGWFHGAIVTIADAAALDAANPPPTR
jgi:hypothetical protein